MSDVLTPLGVFTLGQAIPGMAALDAFARTALAGQQAELSGKLSGLLSVSAALTVPPAPGATAAAAGKLAVQLALNPNIAAPSLQLSANAAVAAEIRAKLGSTVPDFALGMAGIAAYNYQGKVGAFGGKLNGALGGGLPGGTANDFCFATVLVTTVPAAAVALANALIGP